MKAVYILIAIVLFVLQTISLRSIKTSNLREKLLLNGCFSLLGGIGMLVVHFVAPDFAGISKTTIIYGVIFGVLFSLTILFYNLALESGPLSYTTFYFSASMVIPAVAGILFFGEPMGKIPVAVLVFLAAFFFINLPSGKKEERKKAWIIYCIICFLCNGLLSVTQKAHQISMGGKQAGGLMLVGFTVAAICYFAIWAIIPIFGKSKDRKNKDDITSKELIKTNWLAILLLTIGSVGGNLMITWLAGFVDSSYLFPLLQGSLIVGVSLISVIFYKEKLSKAGWIGIALGVLAIVVINL